MKRPGLELRLLHAMAEPGAQQDKFHPDPQLAHQGPGKEAAKNCLKTDKTPITGILRKPGMEGLPVFQMDGLHNTEHLSARPFSKRN